MSQIASNPSDTQPSADDAGLSIATVARETGLAKDTLRVWEKRYGFPRPDRDASGDRLYSAAQVQRLKLIARLLDAGMRPGKVVGLEIEQLHDMLARRTTDATSDLSKTKHKHQATDPLIEELLEAERELEELLLLGAPMEDPRVVELPRWLWAMDCSLWPWAR